jgi:hypothetical protein
VIGKRKENGMRTKLIAKSAVVVVVLALSALILSACGSPKAPQYLGGGNGGGSRAQRTILGPSSPIEGAVGSATWVAAQFVAINWSLNPNWPSAQYAYVLERPYLTSSMNAANTAQAARPVPSTETLKWQQDVKFKAGAYALVNASWVVTTAGVTSTRCVVQVSFSLGATTNGLEGETVGPANVYAFRMEKIGGTWLVASGPLQPE